VTTEGVEEDDTTDDGVLLLVLDVTELVPDPVEALGTNPSAATVAAKRIKFVTRILFAKECLVTSVCRV
jgi:hypothetical protein